jgi:hypothetical protein
MQVGKLTAVPELGLCRILQVTISHVYKRKWDGPQIPVLGNLTDSRLMGKDKSEKKTKHVSGAVPAEAEEDVEMKVSSGYACLEE